MTDLGTNGIPFDHLRVLEKLPPEIRTELVTGGRWDIIGRLGVDLGSIITFDPAMPRDPRLLVPVDLQAYVSPDRGSADRADVRARGIDEDHGGRAMPKPFSDAAPLPPGIHLHWALPDGLTKADPERRGDETVGDLGYRPLPDRWLVTRMETKLVGDGRRPTTSWVVESTNNRVVPLAEWRERGFDDSMPGAIAPGELHPGSGGDAAWAAVYDSVAGRFGFHDPLDGVTDRRPTFTYTVVGWYSEPELDPLHPPMSIKSYEALLDDLGWDVDDGAMDGAAMIAAGRVQAARQLVETSGGNPDIVRVISAETSVLAGMKFDRAAEMIEALRPTHPRQSIYHGTVYGVLGRGVPKDGRPKPTEVGTSLGPTMSDATSKLLADDSDQELLLAAFTHRLLDDAITADDWSTIDGVRHQRSFVGVPDPAPPVIETIIRDEATPIATRVGATGITATRVNSGNGVGSTKNVAFEFIKSDRRMGDALSARALEELRNVAEGVLGTRGRKPFTPRRLTETVSRPGPRYWQPSDPVLVLRGAGRTLRHGNDGRFEPGGTVACRLTGQSISAIDGVIDGSDVVAPLGHGGIPPECDELLEEAALTDPSAITVTAAIATSGTRPAVGLSMAAVEARLEAETTLNRSIRAQVGELADLASFSLQHGVIASPLASKEWTQPWIPLYLEWEAELHSSDRMEGWTLGEIDLDAPANRPATTMRPFAGRAHLAGAATKALANTMDRFLDREARLDLHGRGLLTRSQESDLANLAGTLRTADISVAALAGVTEQLIGFDPEALHEGMPAPTAVPTFVRGGAINITKLRLVDAFGQFLDLTSQLSKLELADAYVDVALPARAALLTPRFTCPTRLRFRFLDATDDRREARVDETTPVAARNPIAGYLLPDHADDAVEVFGPDGNPLGQLFHRGVGRSVTWEGPPGLDGPTATGPVPSGATAHLARLTDAMIRRDVADPTGESPLAALLRIVDTTTWTIDPFGSTGTEHTSVLLGRPIAVVRASIGFDVIDEPAVSELPAAAQAARAAELATCVDRAVDVRLGSLTRFDDGLLGFFLDDDYSTLYPVHASVRSAALPVGTHQGFLGSVEEAKAFGETLGAEPIVSGFVGPESTVKLRPGQTRMVTLLLLPGHGVHATAGIVPRKKLELARSWVGEPLGRIVPSFRFGPVLVDPKSIRMPPISALGPAQEWSHRDTPASWRNDPIAAASDLARLPDSPAQAQEGWVRAHTEKGGS
ncbi:MAG: hypothetical protein ACR2K0_05060 [Acidimicrobiales bacterium]